MSKVKINKYVEITEVQADEIANSRKIITILQKELEELKANSPKYKIGQKVYLINSSQIVTSSIIRISINKENNAYSLTFGNPSLFNENQLFATIQDLLDYLACQEIKEL